MRWLVIVILNGLSLFGRNGLGAVGCEQLEDLAVFATTQFDFSFGYAHQDGAMEGAAQRYWFTIDHRHLAPTGLARDQH
jgi:hypothetical protein